MASPGPTYPLNGLEPIPMMRGGSITDLTVTSFRPAMMTSWNACSLKGNGRCEQGVQRRAVVQRKENMPQISPVPIGRHALVAGAADYDETARLCYSLDLGDGLPEERIVFDCCVGQHKIEIVILEGHGIAVARDDLKAVIFVRSVDVEADPLRLLQLRKAEEAVFRRNRANFEYPARKFGNDAGVRAIHRLVHSRSL
jgi:hypothetical protein